MNVTAKQFPSIEQVTDQYLKNGSVNSTGKTREVSFEEVLRKQQEKAYGTGLKFSKHASMRLNERDIILTQNQSTRLENGVDAASKKGINDSLVLVDNLAFIVNVPNKTVVTAMDQTETNSNVFTNIDGAVIM